MASLVFISSVLLTGCFGYTLRYPEQSLNQALFCDKAYCPYQVKGTGSELNLLPGYRLEVNSVTLAIPAIKDRQIYLSRINDAAPNVNLPSISSFEFQIPLKSTPVSRKEALFVAFLLAAALDKDKDPENWGRDYSSKIEAAKTDPSAVDRVVREYTTKMKIIFPTIQGYGNNAFDRFHASYCSSKGKSGKLAASDVQTLQFGSLDAQGNERLFYLGGGLDWSYSWTTGDVLEHEVNTSVILTDDLTNTMFGFDVRLDLKLMNDGTSLSVNVCESLGEVADRIGKQPLLLIRDCRVAPKSQAYQGGGLTRAPCSEEGDRLVIRLEPAYLINGSFLDVDAELVDRLMLLPGDEVLFGD
ncbi:hypothetical protein GWZ48_004385 [Vibrio fluvialis]|nr:hypothetical protein [Vibrio fluvialis]